MKGLTGILCVAATAAVAAGAIGKGYYGEEVPKAKRASFSRYLGRLLKNQVITLLFVATTLLHTYYRPGFVLILILFL